MHQSKHLRFVFLRRCQHSTRRLHRLTDRQTSDPITQINWCTECGSRAATQSNDDQEQQHNEPGGHGCSSTSCGRRQFHSTANVLAQRVAITGVNLIQPQLGFETKQQHDRTIHLLRATHRGRCRRQPRTCARVLIDATRKRHQTPYGKRSRTERHPCLNEHLNPTSR